MGMWRKSDREPYLGFVNKVMFRNAEFLEKNLSKLLEEIEGLIDYALRLILNL